MMRVWINKGTVAVVTGGETFIPGEWLTLDETWGEPCHPDIVEAGVYLLKAVVAAKAEVTASYDAAKEEYIEDEKFQADLAVKLKEQGIDQVAVAVAAANKEAGLKSDPTVAYVTSVLAVATAPEEAAKG